MASLFGKPEDQAMIEHRHNAMYMPADTVPIDGVPAPLFVVCRTCCRFTPLSTAAFVSLSAGGGGGMGGYAKSRHDECYYCPAHTPGGDKLQAPRELPDRDPA
jgi:hypothetical protein